MLDDRMKFMHSVFNERGKHPKGENSMKTREQIIGYYEGQLEKVRMAYPYDPEDISWDNERNGEYVKGAEKALEAVKNGFWPWGEPLECLA